MYPYTEGYEDGYAGEYDNPYQSGTPEYYKYQEGFEDGSDDYDEDMS